MQLFKYVVRCTEKQCSSYTQKFPAYLELPSGYSASYKRVWPSLNLFQPVRTVVKIAGLLYVTGEADRVYERHFWSNLLFEAQLIHSVHISAG
jgi:hypothetical protein